LNAVKAAANKIDGPAGFFLGTHADDVAYYAARRPPGTILKFTFSDKATKALGGLGSKEMSQLGNHGKWAGEEVVIGEGTFDLFNALREAGEIVVTPHF
jgi:hypothetical protein